MFILGQWLDFLSTGNAGALEGEEDFPHAKSLLWDQLHSKGRGAFQESLLIQRG